ncbi:MAG: MCE family protein [Candidatus Sericytochromatia bacterium]|uniref:MCE family protein n=1 Tax=Candidatus Tanganyikabacteria bacterium TaxID=2961651 RepID=A0A937X4J8_9BACT|nr:MCE family protein [Candidatus Tanganyikabacteria bacterium]
MKIFLSYRERVAGLFIVVTLLLVAAFFVGAAVRNRWLAPRVTFQTLVARGDGLRPGSPILLSGVEIGEVGRMSIRDDDRIEVELVVLESHARRVREGTRATVRRLLGIGEKRVHLSSAAAGARPVSPGADIPADEPVDLLEILNQLDLNSNLAMLNRGLKAAETLLGKLEEDGRLEKLVSAADRIGPTLERVDSLLDDLHKPLISVVANPALNGTLNSTDRLLKDPAIRNTVQGAAKVLEPARINRLLARTENLLAQVDKLAGEKGPVSSLLVNTNSLLADGRVDRLITSLEKLTDEKKLGKIIDDVAVLTGETSKVSPEIPEITKELTTTLRETTILLKALQKVWILDGLAREAREEVKPRGPAPGTK